MYHCTKTCKNVQTWLLLKLNLVWTSPTVKSIVHLEGIPSSSSISTIEPSSALELFASRFGWTFGVVTFDFVCFFDSFGVSGVKIFVGIDFLPLDVTLSSLSAGVAELTVSTMKLFVYKSVIYSQMLKQWTFFRENDRHFDKCGVNWKIYKNTTSCRPSQRFLFSKTC